MDDDDDHNGDDGDGSGFTCCQLADLSNRKTILDQRIDMIFARNPHLEFEDVTVLGVTASKRRRAAPGVAVWPSDHASVAAELEF